VAACSQSPGALTDDAISSRLKVVVDSWNADSDRRTLRGALFALLTELARTT
jgi:hypothetical protein